jgi:hypothetical protein
MGVSDGICGVEVLDNAEGGGEAKTAAGAAGAAGAQLARKIK